MKLFLEKMPLRKKFILISGLVLTLLILGIFSVWLIKNKPWAAEVIGTPQTINTIKSPKTVQNLFYTQNPARLYTQDDYGLRFFDVSDPANSKEIGDHTLMGIEKFFVNGNFIYTLSRETGTEKVRIFDSSNLANIQEISNMTVYHSPYYSMALDYFDNKLYVANSYPEIKIINISNPSSPVLEKTIDITTGGIHNAFSYANDIKIKSFNNKLYAFVANRNQGLKIIDLESETIIGHTVLSTADGTIEDATDVLVDGEYAYVAARGVHVVSLSGIGTPGFAPTVVNKMLTENGEGHIYAWVNFGQLSLNGRYLYASNAGAGANYSGVYVFDVSDPPNGHWIPTSANPPNNNAFGPDSNFHTYPASWDVVASEDGYLYAADDNNLFDVFYPGDNPTSKYPFYFRDRISNAPTIHWPYDAKFLDNNGLAVMTIWGMDFVDITDPNKPIYRSNLGERTSMPLNVYYNGYSAMATKGNLVFYSAPVKDNQFVIADANSLADPKLLSTLTLNDANNASPYNNSYWSAYDMAVSGNYAYLAVNMGAPTDKSGLFTINISDLTHPVLESFIETGGNLDRIHFSNNYIYAGDTSGHQIQVIDVTDPANPQKVAVTFRDASGQPITSFSYPNIKSTGNNLIVSDFNTGSLFIYNNTDRNNPTLIKQFHPSGALFDYDVSGNLLYTTGSSAGSYMYVYDIEDPANPRLLTRGGDTYSFGTETRLHVKGDLAIATGHFPNPAYHVRLINLPDLVQPAFSINKTVSDNDQTDQIETLSNPGETLEYKLNYTNTGNQALTGVTITDQLPNLTTYDSGGTYDDVSKNISFNIGSLAAGQSAQVSFKAKIQNDLADGVYEVVNSASIDADQLDPMQSNQVISNVYINTPVLNSYSINKTVSDSDQFDQTETISNAGETLEYKLNYTNTGDGNITNVVITDQLPDLTTYDSGGTYDDANKNISFNIGSLAVGQSAQVSFKVKINDNFEDGVYDIVNTASIDADQLDALQSNQVISKVYINTPPPVVPPGKTRNPEPKVPPTFTELVKTGAGIAVVLIIAFVLSFAFYLYLLKRKKQKSLKKQSKK